jgi:hypothetical protein
MSRLRVDSMNDPVARNMERRAGLRRATDSELENVRDEVRAQLRGVRRAVGALIVVFTLGCGGLLLMRDNEHRSECERDNRLRLGIREALHEIAQNTPDPDQFLDAAEPLLRRTALVDC